MPRISRRPPAPAFSPVPRLVGGANEPGLTNVASPNAPQASICQAGRAAGRERFGRIGPFLCSTMPNLRVTPQLIQLIDVAQPPRDFVATSVAGWFDLPKWYRQLGGCECHEGRSERRSTPQGQAAGRCDVAAAKPRSGDRPMGAAATTRGNGRPVRGRQSPQLPGAISFRQYLGDKSSLSDAEARALLEDPHQPGSVARQPEPDLRAAVRADHRGSALDASGSERC